MGKIVTLISIKCGHNSSFESSSVLQLAAVKIEDGDQVTDSYFSFVKPGVEIPDFEQILSIMPFTKEELLSGRDLSEILPEFLGWCGVEASFVLWNSYHCRIFEHITEGYLPIDHKTLDLQLVYEIISKMNPINLEQASINEGVKIFYPLHHALNDSYTLTELYRELHRQYDFNALMAKHEFEKAEKRREKRRAKRKRQSLKRAMNTELSYQYFTDMETGKIHKKGCSSLQGTWLHLKGFDTLRGALKEGKALCTLCFDENISFEYDFTIGEKVQLINLHNLCADLNIKSKNQGRQFTMITDFGRWYFVFGEGVPTLYHHNNIYPNKNNKGVHHYHKQPVKFDSYQDMISYIQDHDCKSPTSKKVPHPKSRLIRGDRGIGKGNTEYR